LQNHDVVVNLMTTFFGEENLLASDLALYGFSATPTPQCLRVFGKAESKNLLVAEHFYSPQRAIEEGFLLRVTDDWIDVSLDSKFKSQRRKEQQL
jgi:hypothetical protein